MTRVPGLVGDRPIVTRLVLAVAAAMTVVLVGASVFVVWRLEYALSRQLEQDLRTYQALVARGVESGVAPPSNTPGETYQVYDRSGAVVGGRPGGRLVDQQTVTATFDAGEQRRDVGSLFPPAEDPYRVVARVVQAPEGPVVVASAISRQNRDEALRELMLQLAIADLATLAAASFVGYRTVRGALSPVERYRSAAERAGTGRGGTEPGLQLPVASGRDDEITRLVHTFNNLLQRVSEATERERQFLADASHELRGPLSLMRAELEWVMLRPRSAEETRAALESLRTQVERLIDLSNELLDLEELRANIDASREPVDVAELFEVVKERHAREAEALGRRIECDAPPALMVHGSHRWLDLALGNLVSNALRHGAGRVLMSASIVGTETRLSVRDEGPGLPEDFVDRAFQRFSRADPSRATPGTGLGLALVQAVAEAHGGTARIDGSTVTLALPRAAPAG